MRNAKDLLTLKIKWLSTGEPMASFKAVVKGEHLILVNNFPADHLYALVVSNGSEISFDKWPDLWLRPAA